MDSIRIINVPDMSPGDAFVDVPEIDGRRTAWIGHSGLPSNALERRVRRPRLSRYRAAWNATGEERRSAVLISHLPRMTQAVELAARVRGRRLPHLAFSFNFTDLPRGRDLALMRRTLSMVEQFCVYSGHEATLYPELFDIPADRFRQVMWGQSAPAADPSAATPDGPFVMAIGGEGRDIDGILAAARLRPDLRWVVVTRPNRALENPPGNVSVRFNLPAALTWGMALHAAAVVVPLRSEDTCCGHITIASTQLLGLPLITTRSHATREYVEGMPGTDVIESNDPDGLAAAAARALSDPIAIRSTAGLARDLAAARYDRAAWARLIVDFAGARIRP